jgi:regulator of protease activity HflC (stomatin/prohibitin superfamily)
MENTPPYLTALFCIYGIFFLLLVVSLVAAIRIVREDKRLSVYRLGRYLGEKGPGLVLLIPFVDRGVIKDLGGEEKAPGQSLIEAVGETTHDRFHKREGTRRRGRMGCYQPGRYFGRPAGAGGENDP